MGAITPTEAFVKSMSRGRLSKPALRTIAAAGIVVALTVPLLAHDPGLSAFDVQIKGSEIVAVLSLAASDAGIAGGPTAVTKMAQDSTELALDGRRLSPSATSMWVDENTGVHVRMSFARPAGSQLAVRSSVARRLARGHRELLSIRIQDGTLLAERMLDVESNAATADISGVAAGTGSSSARFFALGVRHILTGYDHLLFLAGVLVVLRRWRDVVQTVTAFTLAHSITLALATTGVLLISGRIVEPLIAASIVYVGVENLIKGVQGARWKLTFGFGLVHGLGFATVLRDLGVGTEGNGAIALPLASFNGGVEVGQMAVALVLVPLFCRLRSRPASRFQFAVVWSVLVITAGSYWLIERIV